MHLLLTSTLLSLLGDAAPARSSSFTRQAASDIEQDIQQVNAARYTVSVLQAGNATTVCNQPNSTSEWDGATYYPALAEQLICEAAIGIVVFPDLNAAATDLELVFTALQSLQQTQNSNVDAQTCAGFDPSTLDAAGLDGEAIESLICSAATSISAVPPATSTASPSETGVDGSSNPPGSTFSAPPTPPASISSDLYLPDCANIHFGKLVPGAYGRPTNNQQPSILIDAGTEWDVFTRNKLTFPSIAQVTVTVYETVWVAAAVSAPATSPDHSLGDYAALTTPSTQVGVGSTVAAASQSAVDSTSTSASSVSIIGTVTALGTVSTADADLQATPVDIRSTATALNPPDTEETSAASADVSGSCGWVNNGSP
ncbi:hypothetical protein B0A55_11569 [Friedmanniomyces simplex]|uniref:Uncharacterized protein n=1 Tax=Friedmanniomyces simplex TaxID=329884 RepID=A0A4V5NFA4_9PEZI|nr:hypothetical protein B0A55_11569 [Friedmanniomyces simplex]